MADIDNRAAGAAFGTIQGFLARIFLRFAGLLQTDRGDRPAHSEVPDNLRQDVGLPQMPPRRLWDLH